MEKRIKRIEIVVLLILVLTLINLFSPYLREIISSKEEIEVLTKELPSDLTKEYLNKTVYKIKTDFNNSDFESLFNIFGDFAKAQLSIKDVEREFVKLTPVTGNIGTYAFSHYTYEGFSENAEWFYIYYKCKFKNGKGTIKVSFRTVDDVSEITGVNINLDGF